METFGSGGYYANFAIVRDLGHLLLGRNGPLGTAVHDSRTTQRSPWISYQN